MRGRHASADGIGKISGDVQKRAGPHGGVVCIVIEPTAEPMLVPTGQPRVALLFEPTASNAACP